jgi:DNA uptake protein ComE-like DNA-binding protein
MKTCPIRGGTTGGFALLAVLVILLLLSMVAASVALVSERSVADAQRRVDDAAFRREAFSTRETLLYLLATQRVTVAGLTIDDQVRTPDGTLRPMLDEDLVEGLSVLPVGNEIRLDGTPYRGVGNTAFMLQDGRGLLSPNWSPWFIRSALAEDLGAEPRRWPDLEAKRLDFQDQDDLVRVNGAERRDYEQKGLPPPTNRPFATPVELRAVDGWSDLLGEWDDDMMMRRMAVTRDAYININTAPPELLRLIPGMDEASARRAAGLRNTAPWTTAWSFAGTFGIRRDDVKETLLVLPNGTGTLVIMPLNDGPAHLEHWTLTGADEQGYPWRIDYDFVLPRPEEGTARAVRPPPTDLLAAPLPDRR